MTPEVVAFICALLPTCVLPASPVDEPTWPAYPIDRLEMGLGITCPRFFSPTIWTIAEGLDDLGTVCRQKNASAVIDIIDELIPRLLEVPPQWPREATLELLVRERSAWEGRRQERIITVIESMGPWTREWTQLHLMGKPRTPRTRWVRPRREEAFALSPWPDVVAADLELIDPEPTPVPFHRYRRHRPASSALVMRSP